MPRAGGGHGQQGSFRAAGRDAAHSTRDSDASDASPNRDRTAIVWQERITAGTRLTQNAIRWMIVAQEACHGIYWNGDDCEPRDTRTSSTPARWSPRDWTPQSARGAVGVRCNFGSLGVVGPDQWTRGGISPSFFVSPLSVTLTPAESEEFGHLSRFMLGAVGGALPTVIQLIRLGAGQIGQDLPVHFGGFYILALVLSMALGAVASHAFRAHHVLAALYHGATAPPRRL